MSSTQSKQRAPRELAIKFAGPVFDPSGYAEFSRSFVGALADYGVPLRLEVLTYDKRRPDLGPQRAMLEQLAAREQAYDVKVINANPDCFQRHRERGCLNIGFTMFETTRLPDRWVAACNRMDGILVPSNWNREVFKTSGVKVPIAVASPGVRSCGESVGTQATTVEPIAMQQLREDLPPPRRSKGLNWRRRFAPRPNHWRSISPASLENSLKFYSIFQWSERKNGHGLLRSYLAEFRKSDDVCLILKTYGKNGKPAERRRVADEIVAVRNSMRVADHAPVVLIADILSKRQMTWLHEAGDCFVLPHRAEGLGLPHLEAMAHGKPVIATGYSGNLEFMNRQNSVLLPYQLRPVTCMESSDVHTGAMQWAEPDLHALRQAMRRVYTEQALATELGARAQVDVLSRFAWPARIERFLSAIDEIAAAVAGTSRPAQIIHSQPRLNWAA